MPKKAPHPQKRVNHIDCYVGKKLKEARIWRGHTQADFATFLGVTPQQLQKYETGQNRIAAGRLYLAAKTLQVPIDHFFEGCDEDGKLPVGDDVSERRLLRLSREFRALDNKNLQSSIVDLIGAMSPDK